MVEDDVVQSEDPSTQEQLPEVIVEEKPVVIEKSKDLKTLFTKLADDVYHEQIGVVEIVKALQAIAGDNEVLKADIAPIIEALENRSSGYTHEKRVQNISKMISDLAG